MDWVKFGIYFLWLVLVLFEAFCAYTVFVLKDLDGEKALFTISILIGILFFTCGMILGNSLVLAGVILILTAPLIAIADNLIS